MHRINYLSNLPPSFSLLSIGGNFSGNQIEHSRIRVFPIVFPFSKKATIKYPFFYQPFFVSHQVIIEKHFLVLFFVLILKSQVSIQVVIHVNAYVFVALNEITMLSHY